MKVDSTISSEISKRRGTMKAIAILHYDGPCVGVNKRLTPRYPKGLKLSDRYRGFLSAMQIFFQCQWGGRTPIMAPVDVVLRIRFPDTDTDALTKPILDALENAGVLASDNLVLNHMILPEDERAKRGECKIVVTILKHQPAFGVKELEDFI